MKKNIVFLCVAAIATAMSCLITSCETLDPEANQPSFTLSLFHVVKYPGAEEAEKTIETSVEITSNSHLLKSFLNASYKLSKLKIMLFFFFYFI